MRIHVSTRMPQGFQCAWIQPRRSCQKYGGADAWWKLAPWPAQSPSEQKSLPLRFGPPANYLPYQNTLSHISLITGISVHYSINAVKAHVPKCLTCCFHRFILDTNQHNNEIMSPTLCMYLHFHPHASVPMLKFVLVVSSNHFLYLIIDVFTKVYRMVATMSTSTIQKMFTFESDISYLDPRPRACVNLDLEPGAAELGYNLTVWRCYPLLSPARMISHTPSLAYVISYPVHEQRSMVLKSSIWFVGCPSCLGFITLKMVLQKASKPSYKEASWEKLNVYLISFSSLWHLIWVGCARLSAHQTCTTLQMPLLLTYFTSEPVSTLALVLRSMFILVLAKHSNSGDPFLCGQC